MSKDDQKESFLSESLSSFSQLNSTFHMKKATPANLRNGELVIVGSGIKSIGHITLETQEYIRQADCVYFAVADPLTVQWIRSQNQKSIDMYQLYDDEKNRNVTYAQMVGAMLGELYKGLKVVGIFYGHPGVFAHPSHRAIVLAREAGFKAKMLAGVSAEDCLFSDLGIDPARGGCQTVEATDFLLRDRQIQPDHHVVIFQVGCVGEAGFNFEGFQNNKFTVFIKKLQKIYGDDHVIINYVASQYSICEPTIEEFILSDLLKPEVAKKITGISTFYIPPSVKKGNSLEMLKALNFPVTPSSSTVLHDPLTYKIPKITLLELQSIEDLKKHVVPKNYKIPAPSKEMFKLLNELALDPKKNKIFQRNPQNYLKKYPEIQGYERQALMQKPFHPGALKYAMQHTPADLAKNFVKGMVSNSEFGFSYTNTVKMAYILNLKNALPTAFSAALAQFKIVINTWLQRNSSYTTYDEISLALKNFQIISENVNLKLLKSIDNYILEKLDGQTGSKQALEVEMIAQEQEAIEETEENISSVATVPFNYPVGAAVATIFDFEYIELLGDEEKYIGEKNPLETPIRDVAVATVFDFEYIEVLGEEEKTSGKKTSTKQASIKTRYPASFFNIPKPTTAYVSGAREQKPILSLKTQKEEKDNKTSNSSDHNLQTISNNDNFSTNVTLHLPSGIAQRQMNTPVFFQPEVKASLKPTQEDQSTKCSDCCLIS